MKALNFNKKPLIMGILNVTPDSFYDGGKYVEENSISERVREIVHNGADIIDIGGESTRPGAEPVPLEEEVNRVSQALSHVNPEEIIISVDTYKAEVAEMALKMGATIINDISALRFDSRMVEVVREYDAYVVIMHMKGKPKDMQKNPEYSNVIEEILHFFKERIDFAVSNGISEDRIILDPGIGFGKQQVHNIEILKNIDRFRSLGYPILIGHSRKSLIGYLTGEKNPENRLHGTLGISAYLALQGVDIIRVHDVKEHVELIKVLRPFINDKKEGV